MNTSEEMEVDSGKDEDFEDMDDPPPEVNPVKKTKRKKKKKKKATTPLDIQVMNEEEDEVEEPENVKKEVYLPGKIADEEEDLEFDPSAYVMLHEANAGSSCLSFDIIHDDLGENRETFPLTMYMVAGTQSSRPNLNRIMVMKVSNLRKTLKAKDSDDDSSSSDELEFDEDNMIDNLPRLDSISIKHHGGINRIRCTVAHQTHLVAAWSEFGKVSLFNLSESIHELNQIMTTGPKIRKGGERKTSEEKPIYVFHGHKTEGFAMDWSSLCPGVLATGDCGKHIFLWQPQESSWLVEKSPLKGHKASVEDLQWSPNDAHLLASCSVDQTIRLWDTRQRTCSSIIQQAHESDVNVISWNKKDHLLVSGGDDGFLKIWDIRNFTSDGAVAVLKHHKEQVTSVEWNPQDSSVFASSGADDQVALWDLAVEKEEEASDPDNPEVENLPPQLLFIHQGQSEIKEVHWHPQVPGMVVSTANSGFNFFRTISV